jgi:hypothetical protein
MRAEEMRAETHPGELLAGLSGKPVSERKWRLFAAACARQVWHLLTPEARRILETVEAVADGRGGPEQLFQAAYQVTCKRAPGGPSEPAAKAHQQAASAVRVGTATEAAFAGQEAWQAAAKALAWQAAAKVPPRQFVRPTWDAAERAARAAQCDLLRDVFFSCLHPVRFRQAWREWHGGAAVRIARDIYDRRRFEELPVLADALEEAGCDEQAVLEHCRGGGPHVRGCWAIDLALGRE